MADLSASKRNKIIVAESKLLDLRYDDPFWSDNASEATDVESRGKISIFAPLKFKDISSVLYQEEGQRSGKWHSASLDPLSGTLYRVPKIEWLYRNFPMPL